MDAILNFIVGVIGFFQHLPAADYAILGALIAASGVQEVFSRVVENDTRTLKPTTNMAVTAALSGVVVAGDTFFSAAQANPNLLGVKEAATIGGMTLVYRFAVKPAAEYLSKLLTDARAYREHQATQKAAAEAQAAIDAAASVHPASTATPEQPNPATPEVG